MPLTLEMPSLDTDFNSSFDPDTALNTTVGTAQTAADLLEQGEAEIDPIDDVLNAGMEPEQIADAIAPAESNGQPAKKKRTRKAKQEPQPGVDPTWGKDVPFDTNKPRGGPDQNAIAGSNVSEPLPPKPEPTAEEKATAENLANLPKEPSPSQRAYHIACLESDYVRLCLEINEVESAIENGKKHLKELQGEFAEMSVELRHARNDALYHPRLPFKVESPPAAVEITAPSPLPTMPLDFYPDAWRSVSINELGLPPKLAEKLTEDGRDTIGRLEDLRAEISQGREKWPKGIGAAKITLIEDAVIKWLTANRDSQVFSQSAETQDAANAGVLPPVESQDAPPTSVSPPVVEQTDEEFAAALLARATTLNNGKPNCLAPALPTDKIWRSGYEAFGQMIEGREQQLTDCAYIPGDDQDDWLRGFMSARAVNDYPDAAEVPNHDLNSLDDV